MLYIKNNTGRDIYDHKSEFTFVPNELLTRKEFEVFMPSFSEKSFEKVNISKNKTHRFFAVRFEDKE